VEAVAGSERSTTRATAHASDRALVFIGFMGAGKSSAARVASAELGLECLDSDRALEAELGESIESFFDREGEAAFREREERSVVEMLARDGPRVVALGGGAPLSEGVRRALERHVVVHLDVGLDDAWHRASGRGRPLARDRSRFDELHRERSSLYESIADAFLPAGGRDLVHRALPSLAALRDAGADARTRLVWATTESRDHPVFMGRGLVESGFFEPRGRRRFVVSDENVAAVHGSAVDRLGDAGRATVPAGEPEKTLARAEEVLRAMAVAGVARDDIVVAVGGGVVGDLAGFCAAVYQRGVDCVQVPTTLVAQVDSAFGGKTGVDLPEGKNYAGAYHQPATVLVDPSLLATLPAAERAAGYAEVVKTALIGGGELWARVRRGGEPDDEVILGCLRTKLAVVAADERDGGVRQVLNLGHTVGHAIEAATGYTRLRHGEAVALGLLCALRLSGREAIRAEVAELLSSHGLPVRLAGVSEEAVVELVARDKKRSGGRVPFVLLESPGAVTPGHEVADADLRAALAEVLGS
jgi:shikimate kinase/3-dehydroquinate synthase